MCVSATRAPAREASREERCGGSPPCSLPRCLLPSCAPQRRAPAGGGGMHGRADASSRQSWWSAAWGSDTRCGGALAVAAERREKVAVCARRTLAGVHRPHVAALRCQCGQPEAQKGAELRLVTPRYPRAHANLRCYGWNVLPVCGGATACGRRPRCFTSGGCEGTTLENALHSAFQYTLYPHVPPNVCWCEPVTS